MKRSDLVIPISIVAHLLLINGTLFILAHKTTLDGNLYLLLTVSGY